MESILLPTDFSATATNAALYALQLAKQMGITRLVLYHSYEIPVSVDPITPGVQMLDLESIKEGSAEGLAGFAAKIKPFAGNITIENFNEYGSLADGLDEVCAKTNAVVVVMGITGGGKLEEKLIGSVSVSVGKHTQTPVIIVPAEATFSEVRSVALASDFERAETNIPVARIQRFLERSGARLFVFHYEEKEPLTLPSHVMGEDFEMHRVLAPLNPTYHFGHGKHFLEAVNDFVVANNIDIVISIPKEHGFFASLFSGESHTKMLAFHSRVPVMAMHP